MGVEQRKIIHIDMDCFFAAVEMRDNPELRDKPIAVGGPASGRGVISTCNYAAREFGVRSAMPSSEALRRCPDLILVPGRMSVYKAVSQQIRQIFQRYTDLIEPLSLDEAYLDVTDSRHCRGSATLMAQQIRAEIEAETGLTASAGIAPNKFLAKIASDENKPNGQCVVLPKQCAEFAAALPLRKIPGVGPRTAERLAQRGLHTGADVLKQDPAELAQWLGKFGPVLYQRAQGIDPRQVQTHRERKSVGVETTVAQDLGSEAACLDKLLSLLPELSRRLGERPFKGINVKLKFSDFQQTTVSGQGQSLDPQALRGLLHTGYQRGEGRGVRLVGVSVTLAPEQPQLALGLE
ncbi:DNA polymerase IV [Ferrimonas marina]|uniref:DNA polymerase IV n=1 Tax=Ferrimonas marina TaxID=299255 RepID=A0A1M5YHA6_9GAMM|nr:DNA polymerase IV [Ferrimonas marina]SHI11269.1 DNA polymerase-4 [Ferrimonas marina]